MKLSLRILALFLLIQLTPVLKADDGHRLWLRYNKSDGTGFLKTSINKVGTPNDSVAFSSPAGGGNIADVNHQVLTIKTSLFNKYFTIHIADIEDVDGLYEVYHFPQLLQKHQYIAFINIINYHEYCVRMLTYSDNSIWSEETGNSYQSIFKKK